MEGWISLQRKMQEHWLWEENRVFSKAEAWIDLLLFVNHAPNKITIKGVIIDVERGSTCRSLETLSKKWKWSTSKVTRFLKLLKSDGMINYETKRVTTYITVCNYESYQGSRKSDETQTKVKRKSDETQTNTNNNDNKDNNDNKEEKNIISFDFEKFILFFAEVTGKKIRNTESLRKLINDIIKTKDYTENDVYSVVKVKTKEWKGKVNRDGKKLDDWLDPKTLFRKSNFDKYVREADNAGNLDLFSTEDNLIRDEFGSVVGEKTDYADLAKYYNITEEEARKQYKSIN